MPARVMIIATDGFEQSELEQPKANLEKAGFDTVVVSLEDGEIRGWDKKDWGRPVKVDVTVDEVEAVDYDALLLPGGQMNPDILRMNDKVVQLVKDFDKAGKPVAAICHAPWLLVEADIVKGRTVTSWPSVRTDLSNAGANVVDQQVAVDGNLITSRCPDDLPAFGKAIAEMVSEKADAEMA